MAPPDIPRGVPSEKEHSRIASEEPRSPETASAVALKTILVVDDQAAVGRSVAFYLEKCGYRTHRVESGDAAIEWLGSKPVDGILLDIQMPKMNGFEACVRLQEIARAASQPLKIWFMTGMSYRELQDECTQLGGLGVFHKPFDWPLLLAALDQGFGHNRSPAPGGQPSESL